jgi:hypothetical protein
MKIKPRRYSRPQFCNGLLIAVFAAVQRIFAVCSAAKATMRQSHAPGACLLRPKLACAECSRATYHPWLKTIDSRHSSRRFHFGRSPLEGFWLSQSKPDKLSPGRPPSWGRPFFCAGGCLPHRSSQSPTRPLPPLVGEGWRGGLAAAVTSCEPRPPASLVVSIK